MESSILSNSICCTVPGTKTQSQRRKENVVVYIVQIIQTKGFSRLKHAQTPIPVSRAPRPLHRANRIVVIKHDVPVNPIPPPLQILLLAGNAIVHHPRMLPGVDTQNGLHVDGAGGKALLVLRVRTHGAGELVAEGCIGRVGGHVDGLAPGVGGRVGRTGVVGAEDLHQALALEVLGQPDEAGAEHGVGGGEEIHL